MYDNVIVETNLSFLDIVTGFIQLFLLGAIAAVFLLKSILTSDFTLACIGLVFGLMAIGGLYSAKTFHLYHDRLVIRRPLFSFIKKEERCFLSDFKEVAFKRIKGRFGGPMMCVKMKRVNEDYRIDFNDKEIEQFVAALQQHGIKVSRTDI